MPSKTAQIPQAQRMALSPMELANRWGDSRQHIYDLLKEGQLKSFRSGRNHRIALSEIERIEAA